MLSPMSGRFDHPIWPQCTLVPHPIRALTVAQEEWYDNMIVTLFETKANFRKKRRSQNTVYNGMSAFMKAKGLNAVSAKPIWDSLSRAQKDHWAQVARQMNSGAADVY